MRTFLLTALVLLTFSTPAHAGLDLRDENGKPYTGWAVEYASYSAVPAPSVQVTVLDEWCEPPFENRACASRDQINIGPEAWGHMFYHEVGHLAQEVVNEQDWAWFVRQMGRPHSDGSSDPSEDFADLYAACAEFWIYPLLRGNPRVNLPGYGSSYKLVIYRRMCRYLRYHTEGLSYPD